MSVTSEDIADGLMLKADEIKEDMDSLNPSSEEWCDYATKYIEIIRYVNKLDKERKENEND